MYGRYGSDALGKALLYTALVIMLINIFVGSWILTLLCDAVLVWALFRFFSRKTANRRAENEKFLALVRPVKSFFILQRDRFRDRKTHVYRKCPHCKVMIRLPKLKGSHTVRCPHCSERFDVEI